MFNMEFETSLHDIFFKKKKNGDVWLVVDRTHVMFYTLKFQKIIYYQWLTLPSHCTYLETGLKDIKELVQKCKFVSHLWNVLILNISEYTSDKCYPFWFQIFLACET